MSEDEVADVVLQSSNGSSLREQLRKEREDAATKETIFLPITTYASLVAKYHLIDPLVEGKEIGERVERQFPGDRASQTFYAAVDTLIAACDGFYFREDDGSLTFIDGLDSYGPEMCEFFGFEDTGVARDVVDNLFNHQHARIISHALDLNMWMSDPTKVDRLGELRASR